MYWLRLIFFAILATSWVPVTADAPSCVRQETALYAGRTIDAGTVSIWNSRLAIFLVTEPIAEWRIKEIQVYVGEDPIPVNRAGNPVVGKFPYKHEYEIPVPLYMLTIDIEADLGSFVEIVNVAVHADLVLIDEGTGEIVAEEGAWAFGPYEFEGSTWGWWFTYEPCSPR